MPAAICTICQTINHWRNQRGARVADLKCYKCGGACKTAYWDNGIYKMRESTKGKGNTGRKKAPCAICGNNCFAPAGKENITVTLWARSFSYQMPVVIEADDVICYRHCIRPPWKSATLYNSDFDIETRDWLNQQINGVGVSYFSLDRALGLI